jgi:Raf kinase inhibitor-like YbhB/YbcL family protein
MIVALLIGLLVSAPTGSLRIASPSFEQGAIIPSEFTCDGNGLNPALQFSGVPAATKSLVLIVFDPDVPKAVKADGRYLHLALWDLTPAAAGIAEGEARQGLNEGGPGGYIRPCPPNGEHRYVFQLFTLDTTLGDAKISRETDLRRAMDGHVLDQAELIGRYTSRMSRLLTIIVGGIVVIIAITLVYRFIARRRSLQGSEV